MFSISFSDKFVVSCEIDSLSKISLVSSFGSKFREVSSIIISSIFSSFEVSSSEEVIFSSGLSKKILESKISLSISDVSANSGVSFFTQTPYSSSSMLWVFSGSKSSIFSISSDIFSP